MRDRKYFRKGADTPRITLIRMKTWAVLIVAIALFLLLLTLLALCPGTAAWPGHLAFPAGLYVLHAIVFLLGWCFGQSRASFTSLLVSLIALLARHYCFFKRDETGGSAVVFLGAIFAPAFTVLFHHLSERRIFTFHGFARATAVIACAVIMLLLVEIGSLGRALSSTTSALLAAPSERLAVPSLGIAAFAVAVPLLLIRKKHESPLLGPLFAVALLFVFNGLNFRSSVWDPAKAEAVLISSMSGAAVILALAVLESSWRNANIDELTQLPGRRPLKHHLAHLDDSYAVAMLDIDHFKNINDRYGHETGDQVLRFVAERLRENEAGAAYRYGGEEFAVVCEEQKFDKVVSSLERLRASIRGKPFVIRAKNRPLRKPRKGRPAQSAHAAERITVTVSIGVARRNERHNSAEEVLAAADKALYRAKEEGRNRLKAAG